MWLKALCYLQSALYIQVSARHFLQSFEAESGWASFVNDTGERILISEKFGLDNPRGSFQLREFINSFSSRLAFKVCDPMKGVNKRKIFFSFLTEWMRWSWTKWGNEIKQSVGKFSGFYIYDHLDFSWGCDLSVQKSFFIWIIGSLTWNCSIPSSIRRFGTVRLSRFPS